MKTNSRNIARRATTLALCVVFICSSVIPVAGAETIGTGVTPTCDEAYYAMLDYYGNLTEGSIVKSYVLNGAESITDYGNYDEVVNLTDGTIPIVNGSTTTFNFDNAPSTFYFEGKMATPYLNLPWSISLHYTLNGVPTKAEKLAGKTGVVEIGIDLTPNENASSYAKYNYTLEAMAVFNQDDILSLEAPGAQVQLIGNLRSVLFLALPGEEQHYTIRVGTESFTFGGVTFLMIPATLGQLEQFADLSQKRNDLEEDYHKLSGSLDELLSAMNNLTGSLNSSADGLDILNQARGTFSDGKGALYDNVDILKGDLTALAERMEPVAGQIQVLSSTVTDSKEILNEMVDTIVSLQSQLKTIETSLENLEDGTKDLQNILENAADMKGSLNRLRKALNSISGGESSGGDTEGDNLSSRAMVKKVKSIHSAYEESDLAGFMAKMLIINGTASSNTEAETMSTQLVQLLKITDEQANTLPTEQQAYRQSALQLKALYDCAQDCSFQIFCQQLPGVSAAEAKQMNDLWIVYSSGSLSDTMVDALDFAGEEKENIREIAMGDMQIFQSAIPQHDATSSGDDSSDSKSSGILEKSFTFKSELGSDIGGENSLISATEDSETNDNSADSDVRAESKVPDESDTVGGAAVDLIADGLDSALSSISTMKKELTNTMQSIAAPTAVVVADLADLCGQLDDVVDLLDDAEDLTYALQKSSEKIQSILDSTDMLRDTLNNYEPTLQQTLNTVSTLSVAVANTIQDTIPLLDSGEDLLKRSGTQLDGGTQKTLSSLSDVLRHTADVMATSGDIQISKNAMSDIIEDLWDDHTGDMDNLLMMDATAQAESLTDSRNKNPQSVQVLIRTQEITLEDQEVSAEVEAPEKSDTFWDRVVQMFKDFWDAITGIFR